MFCAARPLWVYYPTAHRCHKTQCLSSLSAPLSTGYFHSFPSVPSRSKGFSVTGPCPVQWPWYSHGCRNIASVGCFKLNESTPLVLGHILDTIWNYGSRKGEMNFEWATSRACYSPSIGSSDRKRWLIAVCWESACVCGSQRGTFCSLLKL